MKFNKLILILVFLILFCNFVNADLLFEDVKCSKDGSLELTVYSDGKKINIDDVNVFARHKTWYDLTLSKFKINGSWGIDYISGDSNNIFKGEEAQLNEIGSYDIILEYIEEGTNKNLIYDINCPGLIFSCKLVNVDIKNCTTVDDKYFSLLAELSGIEQSSARKLDFFEDISYGVIAENSYTDIKGLYSNKGSLPKDMKIQKIDEKLYLFSKEFDNNSILSFNIYLRILQAACKDSNLYDYKECIKIYTDKEEKEEIIKEEIKVKNISKVTGNIVKIEDSKGFKKSYLIYMGVGLVILLIIIVIIKKQKVNK